MEFRSAKLPAADAPGAPTEPDSATLRAFALLELIAGAPTSPSLEDLTRASGLPKPSVYRIVRLLMRGGLVDREMHEKRYVIGSRMSALSLIVQMRSPQRRLRRAILARLVDEIGETCNLTMIDGNEVVYLDRVETSANVRLHMRLGSRVPLHCTASGKLLLSDLPIEQVRRLIGPGPLKRYTERTIVSVPVLVRELAKVRASGIGTDNREYLTDSVCLAVPVTDPRGRICAAVAVHGPAPRMTLRKGHGFVPALKRAAAAIAATFSPADVAREATPLRWAS